MRPRLRFSLRTLFVAATVVAVVCYWMIRPTIIAERFVRAVSAKNYERADACFRSVDDRFLLEMNEKHWRFFAQAELQPGSYKEFVRGHRRIELQMSYGDAGPMVTQSADGDCHARRLAGTLARAIFWRHPAAGSLMYR